MKKRRVLKILKILIILGIPALAANCASDVKEWPDKWDDYMKQQGIVYCLDFDERECYSYKECPPNLTEDPECPEGYSRLAPSSSSKGGGGSSSSAAPSSSSAAAFSSSSVVSSSSGGSYSSSDCGTFEDDYFTDPRDCNRYKWEAAPDGTIWMSENLNYSKGGTVGYCYKTGTESGTLGTAGEDGDGCGSPYGRTYTWLDAMDGTSSQGLCPAGWHVPSVAEWETIAGQTMSDDFYVLAGNYNANSSYALGWRDRNVYGFYWFSDFVIDNGLGFVFLPGHAININTAGELAKGDDKFSLRCVMD